MILDKWESESAGLNIEGARPEDAIDFSFDPPTNDWAKSLSKPTINIYLYKITENCALRSNEWKKVVDPETGKVTRQKPKTRINCSYVITAWVNDGDNTNFKPHVLQQHKILSETMAILTTYDAIPKECWSEEMKEEGQDKGLPSAALLTDDVKSPGEFWSALDNKLAPFLHYVVTVSVTPKTNDTPKDATPVHEIDFRSKLGTDNLMDGENIGRYLISGSVIGIPLGKVGVINYPTDKEGEVEIAFSGELQYIKNPSGEDLNQIVSDYNSFDEMLDKVYLDVYEQVRTAKTGTQYDRLAILDPVKRTEVEEFLLAKLKQEKIQKSAAISNYTVKLVDSQNPTTSFTSSCEIPGRFTFRNVPAIEKAELTLFEGAQEIRTEEYEIPVPVSNKGKYSLRAAYEGQFIGHNLGDLGVVTNSFTLNTRDNMTYQVTTTGSLNVETEGNDLETMLNTLYGDILLNIASDIKNFPEVGPGLNQYESATLRSNDFNAIVEDLKAKVKEEHDRTLVEAKNFFSNCKMKIGDLTEISDTDGYCYFPVTAFPNNPMMVIPTIDGNTMTAKQATVDNGKFTIDFRNL